MCLCTFLCSSSAVATATGFASGKKSLISLERCRRNDWTRFSESSRVLSPKETTYARLSARTKIHLPVLFVRLFSGEFEFEAIEIQRAIILAFKIPSSVCLCVCFVRCACTITVHNNRRSINKCVTSIVRYSHSSTNTPFAHHSITG